MSLTALEREEFASAARRRAGGDAPLSGVSGLQALAQAAGGS